ncbi:uncharacterized protein LODBEIA_P41560 [Lodderomyces beijingensis]|uniref:WH2 domain-containing protein n=1 Tax=Lodderomyces beijingensis TaxID=1775926 RepID=A0ABP0ZUG8_9ASCO
MSTITTTTPSASSSGGKIKTPLKKEELDKIARQLKQKLSKASIAAKQTLSPTNMKSSLPPSSASASASASSPLQNYLPSSATKSKYKDSPLRANDTTTLSSSPNFYSPSHRSPTHMKTPAAVFLSSSPLKNTTTFGQDGDEIMGDSPTKRRKTGLNTSTSASSPTKMVLAELAPSSQSSHQLPRHTPALKPSLDMSRSPIRPSQSRRRSSESTREAHDVTKTPRPAPADTEGADLLIYLATSPSPAKAYKPRVSFNDVPATLQNHPQPSDHPPQLQPLSAPQSQPQPLQQQGQLSASTTFVPPPLPPATPKRISQHHPSNARTPQNRLTPFLGGNLGSNLPSSGLTLTPQGFNMNDYVNIFTPSPGQALKQNLLRTPDFNSVINGGSGAGGLSGQTPGAKRSDGKLWNFNKVLFNNHGAPPPPNVENVTTTTSNAGGAGATATATATATTTGSAGSMRDI